MSSGWTTVYAGPLWEAIAVQSTLEAAGFLTFVPDANIKVVSPAISGANALDALVQVPEGMAERALTVVNEREAPAAADHDTPLRKLGTRVCWAALLFFTAPYALILARKYFDEVRRLDDRPDNHRQVVRATVLAVVMVLSAVMMLATGAR